MRKLLLLLSFFLLTCCSYNDNYQSIEFDYMSHLKDVITIEQLNSTICFSNTASYQTRTGDNVKEYEIAATTTDKKTYLINNLIIEETSNSIIFQHYTEEMELIASIECDKKLYIQNIEINELTTTRSLRGWWVCTQIEYHKTKEQQTAKDSMILDICSDFLPMAVINATISGLYCMGIA